MWSIGCIFAEMILNRPLFPGTSVSDQITRIFTIVGSEGMQEFPDYKEDMKRDGDGLFGLERIGEDGLDLLKRMLISCPEKRISANEALAHRFFVNNGLVS